MNVSGMFEGGFADVDSDVEALFGAVQERGSEPAAYVDDRCTPARKAAIERTPHNAEAPDVADIAHVRRQISLSEELLVKRRRITEARSFPLCQVQESEVEAIEQTWSRKGKVTVDRPQPPHSKAILPMGMVGAAVQRLG